jgi:hypothetical protein
MTDQPTSNITFHDSRYKFGEQVIRIDKEGFHYRGQFIADAGEAHRLMVEFLKQQTQPAPQRPTDEELWEAYDQMDGVPEDWAWVRDYTRAVLARWGRPAIKPVPVAERLPGPKDCTTNPRTGQGQWCWGWVQHDGLPYSGRWRMMRQEWLAGEAVAWLPAHALVVPQQEADRG